jgi:trehalose 6-phosphate synthase
VATPPVGKEPGVALGVDAPVVLLSHRGPVTFKRVRGSRRVTRGAGGLASALTGLAGQLDDAVWVFAATTPEDRKVAQQYGDRSVHVALDGEPRVLDDGDDAGGQSVRTRMVVVDKRRHEDFYTVIANPLLWFVQHGLYGLAQDPVLGRGEMQAYERGYVPVNEQFADAVVAQVRAHGDKVLVMIHDYHFYLVGEIVRRACPDAVITHFVHIPWPGPDGWRVLPLAPREQLLRGLLGCDVVAFHTRRFARNFLLCCQEVLDLRIDLRRMTVTYDGRTIRARAYPISVDVGAMERLAATPTVARHRQRLERSFLADGRKLVLRVDRTDPSKNITRGFRAFDVLLADHHDLHGKVTFFAMCQPSRQDVPEYADYISSMGGLVAEINARHGGDGWQPAILRLEDDLDLAVAAYSLCDALLVNAVNDGMNLVAKEMPLVNQRGGVLLLSENTGAHEELGPHALTVYPFDVQQQADALYEALTMDEERRRKMLAAAADVVRRNDVTAWFQAQLRDVADLLR